MGTFIELMHPANRKEDQHMAGKSKRFCIGTEGATSDGRTIDRVLLEQMARNYDPKVYGARINLEHIKGYTPDSPFRRYGDVLSLSTEEGADGKLRLYAVIDPTDDLIAMTKARQKVYSSMEIRPEFADTGEAYLVGLAVTDDPASLGTEMLQFSAKAARNPLASRKLAPENLFSEAVEFTLELDDAAPSPLENFAARIRQLLGSNTKASETNFSELRQAVEVIADSQKQLLTAFESLQEGRQGQFATMTAGQEVEQLAGQIKQFGTRLDQLVEKLSNEQATPERTRAAGGDQGVVTDC